MNNANNTLARFLAPVAAGLALGAGPVHAASVSYLLDQSNALDDGVNYLQVTVADGLDGAIDFTVEVLDPLVAIADDNFGIQSFAFNVVAGGFAEAADIDGLPDGWNARNGKRMDGFGLFDIKLKGRGWARTETLTFSITGVDGDTPEDYAVLSTGRSPQGHQFFAARVAGFEYGDCDGGCDDDDGYEYEQPDASVAKGMMAAYAQGGHSKKWQALFMRDWRHGWDKNWDHEWDEDCLTSAFFGGSTAVPLPATAWLFGAGIVGALTRARKRRG